MAAHTPFEKRIFLPDYVQMTNNASIRHLRCFVAVAEEGSFARAADRLGLTHSALSATIKAAEAAMGDRHDLLVGTDRLPPTLGHAPPPLE